MLTQEGKMAFMQEVQSSIFTFMEESNALVQSLIYLKEVDGHQKNVIVWLHCFNIGVIPLSLRTLVETLVSRLD